ncbi:amino acid ABC transporter substrate-binding protein, PAAT family [Phyllobacterium sp. YR620]|uniref:Transporter substrate-binding domain-containing protein n=1 Tax=Phyllobacterium pellucidum TaxID=2740464 RepID=A0A849VUP5_9HYPH|nr:MULTISPECIES: transporter substrate-binding domain-containing protein [Phyllobacterium]MRG57075.1 transporter substrate-binding domain-containing protein [Phyllobacterium sp. SYP-B3895]NTS31573.1 transporter substrate-binding domain-containing protein [Phyllobacterium pellucidum]UGY09037.1 transporter substrate-binding domain-containing protein [Phyllobacterium sp. T1018]SDP01096.1 amino acid ABC transporter substrate-binding protein, PAAT family [Phyllobacterium sp. YR620]SFI98488.1 amino 
MRITKRLALAFSAAAIAFTMGAAHAEDALKLTIASEGAYPPFNNLTPDGKLVGFDIDIGNALCEEMKAQCTWVSQDWDGMIPALQAGKFDAIIASMSITPERLQKVDFSKKYYNTPPGIAVPKDSDVKDITPEALKGKTLGVQASTSHSNYAQSKYAGSEVKMYPTADEYKLDISNGRVDAVMDDVVVLGQWLDSDAGACCKLLGTVTPDPAIHGPGAGVTVKKGNTALADKFTAAIAAIRANGKYKEINDKYFKIDVYGGEN